MKNNNYAPFTDEQTDKNVSQTLNTEKDEFFKVKLEPEIQKLREEIQTNKILIEKLEEDNKFIKESLKKIDGNIGEDPEKQNNSPSKNDENSKEMIYFEEERRSLIFKEEVESDSYLYFSVVLSYNVFFLLLRLMFRGICDCKIPCATKLLGFISICFAPLLYVPGVVTPIIQLSGFAAVLDTAERNFDVQKDTSLMPIKMMVLIVFIFMVAKEASQSINALFYLYFEARFKWKYFTAGCFLPQLIQITMSFFLLYISVLLILSSNDAVDLIQNFAALFILLEIDTIVMDFVRLTKLNTILLKINLGLIDIRKKLNSPSLIKHHVIQKILAKGDIFVNFNNKAFIYKFIFIFLRIFVVISMIVLTLLVWYYKVNGMSFF